MSGGLRTGSFIGEFKPLERRLQGIETMRIDYDSVAEFYDLYVTADHDTRFFLQEAV